MEKIFESGLAGFNESAEKITVYELDNEEESEEIEAMSHNELCEHCGVFDETGYMVAPGAIYHTYSFNISSEFLVMHDTVSRNI